jgi:ribose transport system permease protein
VSFEGDSEPGSATWEDDNDNATTETRRRHSWLRWGSQYAALATIAATVAAFSILRSDAFFTLFVFKSILRDAAPLLILSLGVTFVLVMNVYDLSLGGTIALCATVATLLVSTSYVGAGTLPAIVLTLALGVLVGLVTGVLVAYLSLPSFILTIATGTALTGISLELTGSNSIFDGIPDSYISIGSGEIFDLPNQIVIAAVALLASHFLLNYTKYGRHAYAIGSSIEAARVSGVRVELSQAVGFGFVGLAAAIGGILLTSQAGAANPNTGAGLLLPAYAAAFLGSCMVGSGRFTPLGTALGALYLQVVGTGLTVLNLSGPIILIVQGVILVAAILLARMRVR